MEKHIINNMFTIVLKTGEIIKDWIYRVFYSYNKFMTLQNIDFNRKNLTIMGVKFPDAVSLDLAASAIASNMYEGFKPTPHTIALIRDYNSGAISLSELVKIIKK